MKKKTRGRNINTASEIVATSACKEIKVATSVSGRDIRSKREKVATTFSCCDISSTDEEVATSLSCHDTRCKGFKVATSVSCRNINCEYLRSRHHSVVVTSATLVTVETKVATSALCRDISLQRTVVATSARCRDITYKESRSRHQSVVATSIVKNQGRDIS